jgi:release factor glutamine methyltransferase
VALADANARHVGLLARARFVARDLFAGLENDVAERRVDLITCNPPYIASSRLTDMPGETRDHEPRLAFDGGAFGLDVISRVVAESPRWLRPGASLCFEVGAATGKFLADRVRRNQAYASVETVANEEGVVRVIVATTRS